MKLFGLEITRARAKSLQPVPVETGWFRVTGDVFPGSWASGYTLTDQRGILAVPTVYACVTMISQDIAKLELELTAHENGIDVPVPNTAPYWKVLRKPNRFQTRFQFVQLWVQSKLIFGNAYLLKARDGRGIVTDLYVLDARRVRPLITEDGAVYYHCSIDWLSGLQTEITVPESEIINDIMAPLFHPLAGVPPLWAAQSAANVANKIANNSDKFFENMSRPSGILTADGPISDETANRLKTEWDRNYSGDKLGKLAVLGGGLKYLPMTIPAQQAQLIEQMKWSGEDIARAFHMPLFKLGGPLPNGTSIQAANQMYWSDCLQAHIESAEALLTEGLGVDKSGYEVEFCLDALLRMDAAAQVESLNNSVGGGWMAPNEARQRMNLPPVEGGKSPYLQQQNYSLEALAKRDAQADPFGNAPTATPPPPSDDAQKAFDATRLQQIVKEMADARLQ